MKIAQTLLALLMLTCTNIAVPSILMGYEPIDRIVGERLNSIAKVIGRGADGSVSYGTGVFIGSRYVVTAKHVLRGCNAAECFFDDGTSSVVLQAFDSNYGDQSVLELASLPKVRPAKLALREPTQGDRVTLAGFDNGKRLRFFDTTIGRAGAYNYGTVTDAMTPSIAGNSGGPVFDSAGALVGTLWGSDGATTSLVNNQATHRFLREVAMRFPDFGRCYSDACQSRPVIRQPAPQAPNPKPQPIEVAPAPQQIVCDCENIVSQLAKLLQQQQAPQLTEENLQQAIHDYLQKDPLTVTMILRNADGSVSEGAVDVAKVIPISQLTEEQRSLVRESLQLSPARN